MMPTSLKYHALIFAKTLFICPFIMLTACDLAPDFVRPANMSDAPDRFVNAPEETEAELNAISMAKWWERIGDPLLHDYVERLQEANLSLKQAGERILQAKERQKMAGGGLYPSVSAEGAASRSFRPGQTFFGVGLADRVFINNYDASLNTSWQLDLFGRVRNQIKAADAQFKASQFDYEALLHSLIAELMRRRVAIASNQRLLTLAQENLENRRRVLTLVSRRFELGSEAVSAADVYLAEEAVSTVEADQEAIERALSNEAYELDILLGYYPGTTDATKQRFPDAPQPMDVPLCLPADLVDRRPDLKAAELRVYAANAEIGLAVADLYPSLALNGSIGYSSINDTDLFRPDLLAGSLLGSITSRLFEGGALRANIRLEESEMRELAANYAELLMNAFREVETALKAENFLKEEVAKQRRAAASLKKAEAVSEARYRRGILSLRDFLNTQQQRYRSEQALIQARQAYWNNRIGLYLALGGDWMGERDNNQAVCGEEKADE